jgi:glycosyltransferase involved in cell wall biosynthesis
MTFGLVFSSWNLAFRGAFTFAGLWDDPRGLSGSEVAFVQYARALKAAGHEVTLYTDSTDADFEGMRVKGLESTAPERHDVVLAFNDPEPLRHFPRSFRVFVQYVNSFDYCEHDMPTFVDLFVSPSEPHRAMLCGKAWPLRAGKWTPDPDKWCVVPLACDPEEYKRARRTHRVFVYPEDAARREQMVSGKKPGQVVYCSSPDRGLHWVLQEWPAIKRAVPHAELHIYYRLRAWLDQWNTLKYNPSLEQLRYRALYIEEALRRMGGDYGILVHDAVSRREIARALSEAEVLAYPVDTIAWTEGFSCSTLEGCAARACPVIFDTDALGDIYRDAVRPVPRGNIKQWRHRVIEALTEPKVREATNDRAEAFARKHTWTESTKTLLSEIQSRFRAS